LVDLAGATAAITASSAPSKWLKQRYTAPLRIEELADAMHMSPSALHHRFKAVTRCPRCSTRSTCGCTKRGG